MVIVMGLMFGYVNHRFLPVVIVTAGLIFTFGFIGLSGMKISMAVIAAFPVTIGLGIDYAIQFQSRLEEEARDHPLTEAIHTTITKTGPAVMYAMLATCMDFVAMFISPVPMMQGFGLVSIIGVVTGYITSLIGIPLIAVLINYKAKGHGVSKQSVIIDSGLSKVAVWIAKRPVPAFWSCSLLHSSVSSLIPVFRSILTNSMNNLVPVFSNQVIRLCWTSQITGDFSNSDNYRNRNYFKIKICFMLHKKSNPQTFHNNNNININISTADGPNE